MNNPKLDWLDLFAKTMGPQRGPQTQTAPPLKPPPPPPVLCACSPEEEPENTDPGFESLEDRVAQIERVLEGFYTHAALMDRIRHLEHRIETLEQK